MGTVPHLFLILDATGWRVYNCGSLQAARGRAVAARQAHNLEVGGSSPPPATLKRPFWALLA